MSNANDAARVTLCATSRDVRTSNDAERGRRRLGRRIRIPNSVRARASDDASDVACEDDVAIARGRA